jgi:hypothetical protein
MVWKMQKPTGIGARILLFSSTYTGKYRHAEAKEN